MRSIIFIKEYVGYTITPDRLIYMIVELMSVPMEFRGRIPRAFTKPRYTCRDIKARSIRIHLKKSVCAGLIYEIKSKK